MDLIYIVINFDFPWGVVFFWSGVFVNLSYSTTYESRKKSMSKRESGHCR